MEQVGMMDYLVDIGLLGVAGQMVAVAIMVRENMEGLTIHLGGQEVDSPFQILTRG
ncbi:MAG: hypothetical protein MMC23_001492 [Stictis urceolatum]|nr:hypothetical protein [Stictis urceolata]